MGNGNIKGKDASAQIEKKMQEAAADAANNHSLLLLGAGESGKSTLLRQMRHIWGKQFQTKERQNYQKIMWANVTESIQILCKQSKVLSQDNNINECEVDEKNKEKVEFALKLNKGDLPIFDEKIYQCFETIWNDKGIKNTLLHRDKYYILDSAEYFLNNMKKYIGQDYVPTFDEICHCRVRTTGIKKEMFLFNKVLFTVFDIGGQRSERRKWLTVCDNVKAVIYVSSLAGYNQVIFEDNKTNRLIEAWNAYDKSVNHDSFKKINIILFLNKCDLFDIMIKDIPFTTCPVDDYKDPPNDKDAVIKYIIKQFQKRTVGFDTGSRSIYPHITCATS